MTSSGTDADEIAIDALADRFFDLFTNKGDQQPEVRGILDFFLATGILINNSSPEPAIYDLEAFIQPREALLSNGTLTDFREWEVSHETVIQGRIAQRFCSYEKEGVLSGKPFTGAGHKMMQFIKQDDKWYFASVIWNDKP